MRVRGTGKDTYLFLNGLMIPRPIKIRNLIELLPTNCSPDPKAIIEIAESETDLGVMALFLRQVKAQIRIKKQPKEEQAAIAWNSLWDAVLLSALFDSDIVCNFQSETPAEEFCKQSGLIITNYHLRGYGKTYEMSESEACWVENHFSKGTDLLDDDKFRNAVHCMATYRWHSHPRAQLALIWAGIEGLFGIDSEIVFRLSLYTARFLAPTDETKRKDIFKEVKSLYKKRSAAVHGSKIKGEAPLAVQSSAKLLNQLIFACINKGSLPDPNDFFP